MTEMTIQTKTMWKNTGKKILILSAITAVAVGSIWAIGGNKASEYALSHANLSKNQVSFIRYEFDFDDFIPTYEVSWYQDSREMEYTVHAFTGQLLRD